MRHPHSLASAGWQSGLKHRTLSARLLVCCWMAPPEWRQKLELALSRNRDKSPFAQYYSVATLRNDMRPANRTVVHRGFHGDISLKWCTDKRSRKVLQVQEHPWGEAARYFEDSQEQFRLGGMLTVVGPEHSDQELLQERQRLWSSLPADTRQFFTYPDPGQERRPGDEDAFKKEPPSKDSSLPASFCLVVHDIDEVDYLSLPDVRCIEYRSSRGADGQRKWTSRDVNL